jgi:hypothetical protein
LVQEKESYKRRGEYAQSEALRIVFFSKHYWGSEMKKDEIGEAS